MSTLWNICQVQMFLHLEQPSIYVAILTTIRVVQVLHFDSNLHPVKLHFWSASSHNELCRQFCKILHLCATSLIYTQTLCGNRFLLLLQFPRQSFSLLPHCLWFYFQLRIPSSTWRATSLSIMTSHSGTFHPILFHFRLFSINTMRNSLYFWCPHSETNVAVVRLHFTKWHHFSASIKNFWYLRHAMWWFNISMRSDSKTTFIDHSGQFPQQMINSGHWHSSKLNRNTWHNNSSGL